MAARDHIRFLLNETEVRLERVGPRDTLLDWLRLDRRLCGAKEGCAEGDCGACTVLVGRLSGEGLVYEPVNACIRLVGSLDATHVVTIEALSAGGALHPVQQAMVDWHGAQCGFCTPGVVMALYALWMEGDPHAVPDDAAVDRALQGNLCRCTGYAPIVRAAKAAAAAPRDADALLAARAVTTARLRRLRDGRRIDIGEGTDRVIAPANADDFAEVLTQNPNATIVAGATDVGLWVTKFVKPVGATIFITALDDLRAVTPGPDGLTIGATASYADAAPALLAMFPQLDALWWRIGGPQVRAAGTIGGNIANGSPIGDTPPPFIALGARLTLRRGAARRAIALEDFFLEYGRQDRASDEFVESVFLPALAPGDRFACHKISKRRDEDISTLCGAFRLRLEDGGVVTDARIAFGGMAATPRRAPAAEAALTGRVWGAEAAEAAASALEADYAPIGDWRASAAYRRLAAANLLRRFALEDGAAAVRLAS